MNKSERNELKSVVKNQFKVLKAEIEQRRQELMADVKHEIENKFAKAEENQRQIQFRVDEAMMAANRQINDILYEYGYQAKSGSEHVWVLPVQIPFDRKKKNDLIWTAQADLNAKVSAADVALARQEADLLRQLAVDAIESDDARAFLNAIPTVSELVPATRLAELEKAMAEDDE